MNCTCFEEPEILYDGGKFLIIRDSKRGGKLIISKDCKPMTKEALEEFCEIHCSGTTLKDSGHISIPHLHIFIPD